MASSRHAQRSRYYSLGKSYVYGGQSIPWIHAAAAISARSRTTRRIAHADLVITRVVQGV
jgi:acyl-CoA hydrolase